LELQDILGDLWGIIRGPVKNGLTKTTCTQINSWAKNFELAQFNATAAFPLCYADCQTIRSAYEAQFPGINLNLPCNDSTRRLEGKEANNEDTPALPDSRIPSEQRQLTPSTFNFEGGAEAIFAKYITNVEDVMKVLAAFHDIDEEFLNAWKSLGIERGLETLYDLISDYDGLMTTITNVFQGGWGGVECPGWRPEER